MAETDVASSVTDDGHMQLNEALWAHKQFVRHYEGRALRAPEVMLLVRHREALSGRVLELGCGGGRLSGYLLQLAREFCGLDISPAMVAHCRETYSAESFRVGDLRDLSPYAAASFDAVVAPYNVLDVLDDLERHRVLEQIRRVLSEDGLLIMSSHNLAFAPLIPKPTSVRTRHPLRIARELLAIPRRVLNHRRRSALQRVEEDYAILIDEAHDYAILHYYLRRDAQEHQLAAAGFELIECLDLDGRQVPPGEQAELDPELHYVARLRSE